MSGFNGAPEDFVAELEKGLRSHASSPTRSLEKNDVSDVQHDYESDDGLAEELTKMESLSPESMAKEEERVASPPQHKQRRRTSLGNPIESDGESDVEVEVEVESDVEIEEESDVEIEVESDVEVEEVEVEEDNDVDVVQVKAEKESGEDAEAEERDFDDTREEILHSVQLTEVLRSDLNLDDSNRMSEEEWRRTSPLIFGDDVEVDDIDPTGSSITASEGGENHFIGGWNELGRLDTSGDGESITIRLKIRGDDSFDLTDANDDSIELGKEAYEGLKDLLRRAEQSHKLTREVIQKKTSRDGSDTPTSDCSSADTAVKSPRQKPKKRYEDDLDDDLELLEPSARAPPKFNNEHAQELLNFLRGSSGIPPALSTVSSSASNSVSGSPHRELRVQVFRDSGEEEDKKLSSRAVPPSPPLSTASTVVDNDLEVVIKSSRQDKAALNPVVVVESKRKKKERKRREERQKLEKEKAGEGKSVKILLPGEDDEKEKEKEKETEVKTKAPKKLSPLGSAEPTYSNPFSVLEGGEPSTSAFTPIQGKPKKKEEKKSSARASPVSSSKKKRGRRGSKSGSEDAMLLEMMRLNRRSPWEKYRTTLKSVAGLIFAALALYLGGFHEETSPSSSLYHASPAPSPWSVSVTSPIPGVVLSSHSAALTWKMFGSAVSPGSEVSIDIILDGVAVQSESIELPSDAADEVTGSLDLPLPEGILRGTHNVTVKCDLGDLSAAASSVFLFMPSGGPSSVTDQATSLPPSSQSKSGLSGTFDPSASKLEIIQPSPGAVVNGDSMVLKFSTVGFEIASPLVKVVLILDGGMEFQLDQDIQTISGLSYGPHSLQLFCILKSDQSILSSSTVHWTNSEIVVGGGGDGPTVDGKPLSELSNALLIELADAKGISTGVRMRLIEELDSRFEEYQRQYYA